MTETKGDDTDRAERKARDEGADDLDTRFEFDSEVMLGVAATFGGLREPLDKAAKSIKDNAAEIKAELDKVQPYWSYVAIQPSVPPEYHEAATKTSVAADEVGTATDYTARSLRASGETYYEEDRRAYLRWKKIYGEAGLDDNEAIDKLKVRPEDKRP